MAFIPIFAIAAWAALKPKRLWAPFRCVIAIAIIFSVGYLVYGVSPELFDLKFRQKNRLVMAIGMLAGMYVGKFASRILIKENDLTDAFCGSRSN